MQKLKIKNRFGIFLLATTTFVLIFCTKTYAGEVASSEPKETQAAQLNNTSTNTDNSNQNNQTNNNSNNASTSKIQVGLQTPFGLPPTDENCFKPLEDRTVTTKDGNKWLCAKDSIRWQQIVEGEDGMELLQDYVALIYKFLAGIIGVAAVLMVVFGGIEIATAGANQNGLQSGKDHIIAALVGVALLFSASLILYTINPNFFN